MSFVWHPQALLGHRDAWLKLNSDWQGLIDDKAWLNQYPVSLTPSGSFRWRGCWKTRSPPKIWLLEDTLSFMALWLSRITRGKTKSITWRYKYIWAYSEGPKLTRSWIRLAPSCTQAFKDYFIIPKKRGRKDPVSIVETMKTLLGGKFCACVPVS